MFERAHQEIPLERSHRAIQQARVRARAVELDHVKFEGQIVVGDVFVIDHRDEALDQVLEFADVPRPPVVRHHLQR